MGFSPAFPQELPPALRDCLTGLGHFVYYPNPGNLGDELIAVATVQVFEKLGLSFEIYKEGYNYPHGYTLVYGGGGIMMPEWGYIPTLLELFSDPGIARCVILPHSMHDCPELLELMDERFTVFLREQRSLEYAGNLNRRATFLPADDMVFYLDPRELPTRAEMLRRLPPPNIVARWFACMRGADKNIDHTMLLARFYSKTYHRVEKRMPGCIRQLPNGRTAAWFMRQDQEKSESIGQYTHSSLDLSRMGGSFCRWPDFNTLGVTQLLHCVNRVDVVISDRLHISVGAAMLGKQTIMLDNNYGKLSGVWQRSMQQMPHVHLCRTPEEFAAALHRYTGE